MNLSAFRDLGNPYWVDILPAGEFLGLADKTILHSGPPIEFNRMCRGHRRSMVNACFFEGWAKTEGEALKLLESGAVKCEAACDYATDGSGYGIITKSVPLLIVEDRDYDSRAGLFPAEGKFGGGFTGWGVYSEDIAANLKWIGSTLFRELIAAIKDAGGFPMKELFAEARRMGDELHSCQKAIDPLFTRAIIPYALKCKNADEVMEYFATTDRFTHNFGQAASRALLLGLEKLYVARASSPLQVEPRTESVARASPPLQVESRAEFVARASSPLLNGRHHGGAPAAVPFLTAAGGNGVEYGIKIAGSSQWFTAPSPMIEGPYLVPGAKRENQLPWIGDSSITECRGWGGQIRPINPNVLRQGEDALPTSADVSTPLAGRPLPTSELTCGKGVLALASAPIINGGMMDINGGWMGAGSTFIPQECFEKARKAGVLC